LPRIAASSTGRSVTPGSSPRRRFAFRRPRGRRFFGVITFPTGAKFPSLVDSLRKKLGRRRYVGIQIEINQKYPRGDERRWRALRKALVEAFPQ